MRSALVFYGQMREFDLCIKKWDTFVKRYTPDIFIHTWKPVDKVPYDPIAITIEKQIDFSFEHPGVTKYSTSAVNVFSQMYSIRESDMLRIKYERVNKFRYDYVIRSRFDIAFHNPGKINLKDIDPDKLNVCGNHWEHDPYKFDDNLMISKSDNMTRLSGQLYQFNSDKTHMTKLIHSGEQIMSEYIKTEWPNGFGDIYKNHMLDFTLARDL